MVSNDMVEDSAFQIAQMKPTELTQLRYEDVKELLANTKTVTVSSKVGNTLNRAGQWDLFKAHRQILEARQPEKELKETNKIKAAKDRTALYQAVESWLADNDFLAYLTKLFNRIHADDRDSFLLIAHMRVLKFIENAEPFFMNIGGDSSGGKTSIYRNSQKLLGFIPFTFIEKTKDGDVVHHCETYAFLITEISPQGLYYVHTVEGQIIGIDEAFIVPELGRQMRRCYVKNMVIPKDTVSEGKGLELEIARNTLFVTAAVDNRFHDPQDLNRRLFSSVQDVDAARSKVIKDKLSGRYRKDDYGKVTISREEQEFLDAVWNWIEDRYKEQICVWCELPTPYRDTIINPRQSEIYMSLILTHAFYRTLLDDEHYANEEDIEFATKLFEHSSYEKLGETVNLTKTQQRIADWVRQNSKDDCRTFMFDEIAKGIGVYPSYVRKACIRDEFQKRSFGEFKVIDAGYVSSVIWNG